MTTKRAAAGCVVTTAALLMLAAPAKAQLDPDPRGAGTAPVLTDTPARTGTPSSVDVEQIAYGAAGGLALAGTIGAAVAVLRRRSHPHTV